MSASAAHPAEQGGQHTHRSHAEADPPLWIPTGREIGTTAHDGLTAIRRAVEELGLTQNALVYGWFRYVLGIVVGPNPNAGLSYNDWDQSRKRDFGMSIRTLAAQVETARQEGDALKAQQALWESLQPGNFRTAWLVRGPLTLGKLNFTSSSAPAITATPHLPSIHSALDGVPQTLPGGSLGLPADLRTTSHGPYISPYKGGGMTLPNELRTTSQGHYSSPYGANPQHGNNPQDQLRSLGASQLSYRQRAIYGRRGFGRAI
ncbi:hypothetical protein JCM10908_003679 [Rhodotorula pacifica]|uniref:uncharacterized protein n=1 Tax=Rhodotorula pacifica TaxID=1495444 RepID=UPI00317C3786